MKKILFLFACLWSLASVITGANAAVILQYHHIATDTPSVTSITPTQFREQMSYLADNDFKVIPLSELVDKLRTKQPMPAKTIAITFDDGYKNIAENAHPILKEFGFPYTLFVAIEPIKKGYGEMMSWQQLVELSKEGAEIANHSWGHEHLIRRLDGESEQDWLGRIEANILKAEAAIFEATGQQHKMLAYPYGEYNQAIQSMLAKHGFAAVGQQSGAAGEYTDLTAIPRFPVAGAYANLAKLKVKMHSLPMPVLKANRTDPQLTVEESQPELQLTLALNDIRPKQVMCFVQGQGAYKPVWIDENTFSVKASKPLPAGRSRYNCTAPSKTKSGYYWFSQAWVRPKDDGTWIKE